MNTKKKFTELSFFESILKEDMAQIIGGHFVSAGGEIALPPINSMKNLQ